METSQSSENALFAGCVFLSVPGPDIPTGAEDPLGEIDKALAQLTIVKYVATPENRHRYDARYPHTGESDWEVILSALLINGRTSRIQFQSLFPNLKGDEKRKYNRPLTNWGFESSFEVAAHPNSTVLFPKVNLQDPATLSLSPAVAWRYGFSAGVVLPHQGKTREVVLRGTIHQALLVFLRDEDLTRAKDGSSYHRTHPYLVRRYFRDWDSEAQEVIRQFATDQDRSANTSRIERWLSIGSASSGGLPGTGTRS